MLSKHLHAPVKYRQKSEGYFSTLTNVVANYSASVGVPCIVINRSVCVSVCPRAYLWNRWTNLHETLCADPLWPWLGPPPAALRYVTYFRFYG